MNKVEDAPNWRHRLYRDLLEPLLGEGLPLLTMVVVVVLVGLLWLALLLR